MTACFQILSVVTRERERRKTILLIVHLLWPFCPGTDLTGDVAVNTNKTCSFLLFSRCCGAEGELDKKINKKVSTLSSEKCYAEFCIKQSSIYRT